MEGVFDFYYSKKSEQNCERMFKLGVHIDSKTSYTKNYIFNKRYTECIAHNKAPRGNFDDMILVHTGVFDWHNVRTETVK